jgi:hypothetical protein
MAKPAVTYKTSARAELSISAGEMPAVVAVSWEKVRAGNVSFVQGGSEIVLSPSQLDQLKDLVNDLINDVK